MNLHELLLKKAAKNELAHFYILETSASPEVAQELLLNFAHNFIRDYYQKIEGAKQSMVHLMDHPDVFVLGNTTTDEDEKEDKFFKVEEAETLSRFFEFKPVQGKRKFAVITEGHRINTTVSNKWLKLLEEPQGNSTIFLLNPRKQQLLATIHSRAIHLRLMAPKNESSSTEWMDFLNEVKNMTLSQFLTEYSRGDRDLSFWINEMIRWESERTDKIQSKQGLSHFLTGFQEMETFHQPTATKWSLFYGHLKEFVLPRLN